MWPNPQLPADLITFTRETPYGKLHFLHNGKKTSLYKKEQKQSKIYGNRTRIYCSFASLKRSRKLQCIMLFLIIDDKVWSLYNLTYSLTYSLSTWTKEKSIKFYGYFLVLDLSNVCRSAPLTPKFSKLVIHY